MLRGPNSLARTASEGFAKAHYGKRIVRFPLGLGHSALRGQIPGGDPLDIIHERQRAQLAGLPGVKLPSSRAPAAPVADGRLAGTPSRARAARPANATACRASHGRPCSSSLSTGMRSRFCSSSRHSRPLRTPPPLGRMRVIGRERNVPGPGESPGRRSGWRCRGHRAGSIDSGGPVRGPDR